MLKNNRPFLLLYTALVIIAYAVGMRVELSYHYVQLLDPKFLVGHFWESIYNLHCQPPMLNFILGTLLWLQGLTGIKAETFVLAMNFVMGLAVTASVATLAKAMIKDRLVSNIVIVLFLVNPYLYRAVFTYFYTIHELLYLTLLGVLVYGYLKAPRLRTYAFICLISACLVYTHSLFHFLWPLPVMIALPWLMRRHPDLNIKGTVAAAALTVVILLAWPVKNYARFGYFGYSSWQGLAFTTEPVSVPAIEVPAEFRDIPVLADKYKSNGTPNWNHYSVIPFSSWMQHKFIERVEKRPGLLWERAVFFYLEGYTIYDGRSTWTGKMYANTPAMRLWQRAYEIIVFQYVAESELEGVVLGPHTGLVFAFPVIVAFALACVFRWRKRSPGEAATAAFMLYCILWVLLLTLTVNGFEGNRYRFATEPMLMVLAGWLIVENRGARMRNPVIYVTLSLCVIQAAVNWFLWTGRG